MHEPFIGVVTRETKRLGPNLYRFNSRLFSHSARVCTRVREVAVGDFDES